MSDTNCAAQEPMSKITQVSILGYLLLFTILTCYLIVSLWGASMQPRVATVSEPQCPKPTGTSTGPALSQLYPNQVVVGSTTTDILVLGCNFTSTTTVKFNGTPRPFLFVDASHIRVGLTAAEVAAASTIVVTLSNNGSDFGSGMVHVVPPEVSWKIFWSGPWPISPEVELLLLVLFTGAFGSSVYALKSFADYQGENKLYNAWTNYYLIQPFEGAGIAFLFYLVVRGGFLTGTGADIKTGNMFGICAIAGLAGAFSDIAFLKLREVFQTLFKPQDDRSGKISPMKVTTTTLPDGAVGTPYKQTLQTSGGVAPLKWSVNPALPAPLTLDATTGTISGTPTGPLPKTNFTFKVIDSATPAASTVTELTLEIKPAAGLAPKITSTTLPDGSVGAPYKQILQASGGVGSLNWSVAPALPSSLALDAPTGTISGTPTASLPKTKFTFKVTDSATPPVTSSAVELALEIK